jgi:hypothetical protein
MTVRGSASLGNVFAAALCAVTTSCSDGSSFVAPVASIDGTWRILRTAGTDPGCDFLFDPAPAPLEITFRVQDGVLETVPGHPNTVSSLEPDGSFELRDVFESPSHRETISIQGRFESDILTATESHAFLYFDPIIVELLGSESCVSTYGWVGERV